MYTALLLAPLLLGCKSASCRWPFSTCWSTSASRSRLDSAASSDCATVGCPSCLGVELCEGGRLIEGLSLTVIERLRRALLG